MEKELLELEFLDSSNSNLYICINNDNYADALENTNIKLKFTIMIKKLRTWGTVTLLTAITLLFILAFRQDHYGRKLDTINVVLYISMTIFMLAGIILRYVETLKKMKETKKKMNEGKILIFGNN